jgi:ABC-type oligopeptide transport system substrate-binding subunit
MDYELAGISIAAYYNDPSTYFDIFLHDTDSLKTEWKNALLIK